jgi:RHS repeat-associated protein
VKVKSAGTSWAAGAGNTAGYEMNVSTENVRVFTVNYVQGSAPVVGGVYPINTLYKLVYTDENGKQVIEYTDKSGQLILKKVQLENTPSVAHAGWICTYFVYDDFGLLRYELQPEAVKYLDNNGWSFAGTNGAKVLTDLCFQYYYDEKGRTVWKKIPGAAPLRMLYDKRDRMVFTQDGNQLALAPDQWTATVYDELDRPLLTTLYNTAKTIATLQTDINNAALASTTTISNSANTGGGSVIIKACLNPLSSTDLNTTATTSVVKYLFYDRYTFLNVKTFNTGFTNLSAYSTSDPNVQALTTNNRTLNMVTGTKTRILGTYNFLNASNYYDKRGSLIQTLADNIKTGTDISTFQYHFDGRMLSSCSDHTTTGSGYTNFKTLTKYLFDKLGRVSSIQKQFGTNVLKTVASYDYDDVGRLKAKHLDPGYTGSGGTELEALNYSYDLHNHITGINKDYALKTPGIYNKWGHFFGMYMGFDNRDNVFTNAQLNGQITGILWNTQGDDAQRKYNYSYDNAGRLTNALFTEQQHPGDGWANNKMDFSVTGYSGKISYDLNGNLLAMMHKGVLPGTAAPVTIDDLRYSYEVFSNKLSGVSDLMTQTSSNGMFGDFKDGANGSSPDYVYDDNGNVVIDLNKNAKDLNNVVGAAGIHYNFLDKPDQIRIAGKGTISIVYSGDGEKLKRTYTPESGTVSITTYINQFVYQASGTNPDQLSFINFEEGRIRVITPTTQNNGFDLLTVAGNLTLPIPPSGGGGAGVYDYFIMDYQQNVRMILSEEIRIAANTCTMETSRSTVEAAVFGQTGGGNEVVATRYTKPPGWTGNTTNSVSRLGNTAGHNVGPNTLQKVMAGDEITTNVQYYYNQSASGNNSNFISTVIGSLFQALSTGPTTSIIKGNATNVTNQLNVNNDFLTAVQPTTNSGTRPLAYLTVLFFDERFNFIEAQDGGAYQQQVASSVGSNGASLTISGVKAPKNGYSFIYVSNQSNQDVYFDNLVVSIEQGNIIEENHYYSYGLKITAISSKRIPNSYQGYLENKNLFNDKELFDEGDLNWYDYGFRHYDPQIGRFMHVDPLADHPQQIGISPYAAFNNNPILYVDEDGRIPIIPWLLKAGAGAAADMLAQASMSYLFDSKVTSWSQAFDNVNWWQVGRSGAEGLIPWRTPGGKIGRAALSATGDVVVNAMNNPSGYTSEQAGIDFTTGFIGDLAGGGFGQILNKYGSKAVINGLMDKMGYGATQIRKMTGGFDGESVRKWYSDKVKSIDINIDPTEANARMVVNQRNTLKQQGRDLMSDRKAAANLDITDPIMDFDHYNTKYSGDYKKIMQGGTKPNPTVNKKYGE